MLHYVTLCSETLLAEGTGGLSAARVFHILISIITPLNITCNIFFLFYLQITEGTGILLVIWWWIKVLWSTFFIVFFIHFFTSSHITLILDITVITYTQSFVRDVNVIFLTNQLDKFSERWICLILWFWNQTDKQVLLKVVGTRREKIPSKAPQEPLDFATEENYSPL